MAAPVCIAGVLAVAAEACLMLEFLFALLLKSEPQIPLPPYQCVQSLKISEDAYNSYFAVSGDHLYTTSGKQCVAVDLKRMKRLWSSTVSDDGWAEHFGVADGILYTSTLENLQGLSKLVALDERSGRVLWSYDCHGGPSALALAEHRIYLVTEPNRLAAIDAKTHKPTWEVELPGEKDTLGCPSVRVSDSVVIVNYDSRTTAIRRADGKKLWTEEHSFHLNDSLVVHEGIVWMSSQRGSVARVASTGKELWRSPYKLGDFGAYSNGKFIGLYSNQVACLDAKDGKTLWSTPKPKYHTSERGAILGGYVFALDRAIHWSGKQLANFSRENEVGLPCWTDGKVMVCFDHDQLLKFKHGRVPPVPKALEARKLEVRRLVANFEGLDAQGRQRLVELGDSAVEPVLKLYMQAYAAYESDPAHGSSKKPGQLFAILEEICKTKHTRILITALEALPQTNTHRRELFHVLAKVGEPEPVTAFFLQELEKNKYCEEPLSYEFVASEYIINGSTPQALSFLFQQLKDPNSDLHSDAYYNLARVAGVEGAKAVLALKRPRTLLRPLEQRLNQGYLDAGEWAQEREILKEATDPSGRIWCLIESGILGRKIDLWVSEKRNGVWSRPIFANVSSKALTEPWLETVAGNTGLAKDADGDHLTDLEEARLGIDPAKVDTDGDGDQDEIDPWPNVANRAPTLEAEKALAAAFEARFHFARGEGAGVFVGPTDLPPLELPGYPGPMLWHPEGEKSVLGDCYRQGVGLHSLQRLGPKDATTWRERYVAWNGEHSEAKFRIVSSYGPMNAIAYDVTVRLVDGHWVVVGMKMAWVA